MESLCNFLQCCVVYPGASFQPGWSEKRNPEGLLGQDKPASIYHILGRSLNPPQKKLFRLLDLHLAWLFLKKKTIGSTFQIGFQVPDQNDRDQPKISGSNKVDRNQTTKEPCDRRLESIP